MAEGRRRAAPDVTVLVHRAQTGDERALGELLALHLPLIYNIVGRALNGHADVDDLVQETMLRIVRGLPALREPDRFRSWSVAIAYRQIQHHQRRRPFALPPRGDLPDVPDPRSDFAERTVTELLLSGQRRELAEAARWLEPDDRRLLALWWQEAAGRLTRGELAEALDVEPPHAAVRLRRMKTKLDGARAVVRALAAVPRCPRLAELSRDWDGRPTPLWRKRLTRHTVECPQCGALRTGLVAPEQLLPGIGVVAVPGSLLEGLRHVAGAAGAAATAAGHALHSGTSALLHRLSAKSVAVIGAGAVAVAGALTYAVWQAPAPGRPGAGASHAPAARPSATAHATPAARRTPPAKAVHYSGVAEADIYVAPGGSDTADGTLRHPYATLGKAVAAVRPGQTIALRGGTYRPADPVVIATDGTAAARITLSNYRDEHPVIDASAVPADKWTITQRTAYWTVQGLEIHGSTSHAYVCRACRSTVFRRMSLHGNADSGLTLRDKGTTGDSVLDSDFYDNGPRQGRGGVGLAISFGDGTGNLVRGCRAWGNGTDGFDLSAFTSPVTLTGNWSYRNGNGFTLGGGNAPAPVAHVVTGNAAWDNSGLGFNDERNSGRPRLTRDTAFRNGVAGFYLADAAASLSGDVSADNAGDDVLTHAVQGAGNTWNAAGSARASRLFASTDAAGAQGPRRADGTLPATRFLVTGTASGAAMTGS